MKAVLAISGGVDSMVMLDILRDGEITVAHFDHGTRVSSADDAKFVAKYAEEHHLPFILGSSELGENVSEETARRVRYEFLHKASEMNECEEIYTAHHLDDLVESVAINLLRGTGWRGLAVLDAPGVRRPFLELELLPKNVRGLAPLDKKGIQRYAAKHGIAYQQDPTNNETNYLRNRVREKLGDFKEKRKLYDLWQRQKRIKVGIDELVEELLPAMGEPWQKDWFQNLDAAVALELLRAGTLRIDVSATRPQLENFRQAILNYAPGAYFNLPHDKLVKIDKSVFWL